VDETEVILLRISFKFAIFNLKMWQFENLKMHYSQIFKPSNY